jgi:hypothetical protein
MLLVDALPIKIGFLYFAVFASHCVLDRRKDLGKVEMVKNSQQLLYLGLFEIDKAGHYV